MLTLNNSDKPTKQTQKQTIPQSREKILPDSYFSDPDLRKIVEAWPDLPEHIKAAIKAMIQSHEGEA